MKAISLFTITILTLSSTAFSAPTVNGNTISWPDDGWYQVQNEANYTEVCAGVRSCTVADGSYIVINHHTGDRFENILVGSTTSSLNEGQLTSPASLTGVVYTATEAEIFWERAEDSAVARYRIMRDGVELDTVDALSYYDNTIEAGTTYEYTVASVSHSNAVSVELSRFLTTPEASSVITSANAEELLAYVFGVANFDLYTDMLSLGNGEIDQNVFTELGVSYAEEGTTTQYECLLGGEYSLRKYGAYAPFYTGLYSDCALEKVAGSLVSGTYGLSLTPVDYVYNPGASFHVSSDVVATSSDSKRRVLTGEFDYQTGPLASWSVREKRTALIGENGFVQNEDGYFVYTSEPFIYSSQAFEGETRVSIVEVQRERGQHKNDPDLPLWKHTLRANFSVQSPSTGYRSLSVVTPTILSTNTEGSCFQSGVIDIIGDDGSSMKMNIGNGVDSSFDLTVTEDGITTTRTVQWNAKLASIMKVPQFGAQLSNANFDAIGCVASVAE